MVVIVIIALRKNRTIIVLFSLKADKEVVLVLKKWFSKKGH
jgi:hypothetical protein